MAFQAQKARRDARERASASRAAPARTDEVPAEPVYALGGTPLELEATASQGRGLRLATGSGGVTAGTTLLCVEDTVSVLYTTQLGVRCHYCFAQSDSGLLRCSQCRFARYCNATCQAAGWKQARHRDECGALQRWYASAGPGTLPDLAQDPGPTVRALAQLLWRRRRQGPTWWAPFAAMQSHRQAMATVEKGDIAQQAVRLAKFLGSESDLRALGIDSAKALLELVCQWHTNAFTLTDAQLDPIGVSLDPTVALLNHSCVPNAVVVWPSTPQQRPCPMEVVALRALDEGERVCISYVDLAAPRDVRQQILRERYHFTCDCPLCSRGSWADPRTARWCSRPGCKGWVGPATQGRGPRCYRCHECEVDTAAKEAVVAEALELVPHIHRGMHTTLDDKLVARLRAVLPRLTDIAPPSHYAMWTLVYAAHVLAIERHDWDEAIQLTMLLCAGMQARGARDESSQLFPPGHPQRAVLLATLGRLWLQAPPRPTPSPLLARAVPWPSSPMARAQLARTVLEQALAEAQIGFGARTQGGWVAQNVRESLYNWAQGSSALA
ncbi:hypothetical protein MNAN1_003433 [Malassezia nana]|uniref:Uncharacterized protein n=1 Tax=Malassezia nana TaxID=180528 RepID=A0AAF0EL47_9BASI|nr:hypothetical protein MNAN1_003433 [Malassezia nana]